MRFAPTIFLSAFLLFQIQPLISKHILPWYGGTPAVWTTCLLFFQSLLFFGYVYAHLSVSKLGNRQQVVVHALLLVAAALVTVLPGDAWKPMGGEQPIFHIVKTLLATVGLPFFVLASSSPLLQAWYARLHPGRIPYRLFAISNAGSLIALLSYPFVIEPALVLQTQARIWWFGYLAFVMFCGSIAWPIWKQKTVGALSGGEAQKPAKAPKTTRKRTAHKRTAHKRTAHKRATKKRQPTRWEPGRLVTILWIGWAACGVILFMSVTNHLTLDIAPVPFLWVMPLSIYLLSFIVAFSGSRWYHRGIFGGLTIAAIGLLYSMGTGTVWYDDRLLNTSLFGQIFLSAVALFVCCMLCHGELYRLKPEPARLTRFYLSISLGGALGGIVVGVIAPQMFVLFFEFPVGLFLLTLLFLATLFKDPASHLRGGRPRWAWGTLAAASIGMVAVMVYMAADQLADVVRVERNFFGLIRVRESYRDHPEYPHRYTLYHGNTRHGVQFIDRELRNTATLYYGIATGVGSLLGRYQSNMERRIGVVGMGTATLAAYGLANDYITFYEIDPDIVDIAKNEFKFLEDTPAKWDVRLGDARLTMEREEDQRYNILVLDAFSSDAIPMHLLTLEAMELYARHVESNGFMAFHVSNRFLNLIPIVYHMAAATGFEAATFRNKEDKDGASTPSAWVLLHRDNNMLQQLIDGCFRRVESGLVRIDRENPDSFRAIRPWTDEYSNLIQVLAK